MKSTFYCHVVSLIVSCAIPTCLPLVVLAQPEAPIRVACLGDSITAGARVNVTVESYPARLQELLGNTYDVRNFGIGGATLISTGRPNVCKGSVMSRSFSPIS